MNQPPGQPADKTSNQSRTFAQQLESAIMNGVASDSPLAKKMAAQNEEYFGESNPFEGKDAGDNAIGAGLFLLEDEIVRLWKEEFGGELPPEGQAPNLYRMIVTTNERSREESAAKAAERAARKEKHTEEFYAKQAEKLKKKKEDTEAFYRETDEKIAKREAEKKGQQQHSAPAAGAATPAGSGIPRGGGEPSAPSAPSRFGAGMLATDRLGAALSGPIRPHNWNDYPGPTIQQQEEERRREYQEAIAKADLQERIRRAERDGRVLENVKNGFQELVRDAQGRALRDSDGRLQTTMTDKGRAQLAKQIRERQARALEAERRHYGEKYAFDPEGRRKRHAETNAFREIPYEKEGELIGGDSPPDLWEIGQRLTKIAEQQDREDAEADAARVEEIEQGIQRDNPF